MNEVIVWRPSNSDTAQLAMEIRADLKAASEAKSTFVERYAAAGAKLLEVRRRIGVADHMNTLPRLEKFRQGKMWQEWLEAQGISRHIAKNALVAARNPQSLTRITAQRKKDSARSHAVIRAFLKLRPSIEKLQEILGMEDPEDALNWCIVMAKRETRYTEAA